VVGAGSVVDVDVVAATVVVDRSLTAVLVSNPVATGCEATVESASPSPPEHATSPQHTTTAATRRARTEATSVPRRCPQTLRDHALHVHPDSSLAAW
jgi:hypothetical protein